MILACKPDNKVSLKSINIGEMNRQAIAANQIDTSFILSSNKSLKYYDSDTIGYIVYNEHGDPISFEWREIMGTNVEFEYNKSNLPISKAHYTDTDILFALKYGFDSNNNKLYQYWIPQFGPDQNTIIDTCWFEFNKYGQLIKSSNTLVKFMGPSGHFITNYKYGTDHQLLSKTEINDTLIRNIRFRLKEPIAPRMETNYFYSQGVLDSSITEYFIQDKSNTVVKSITHYQNLLPIKTVLADTIVTMFVHKKGSS